MQIVLRGTKRISCPSTLERLLSVTAPLDRWRVSYPLRRRKGLSRGKVGLWMGKEGIAAFVVSLEVVMRELLRDWPEASLRLLRTAALQLVTPTTEMNRYRTLFPLEVRILRPILRRVFRGCSGRRLSQQ